MTSNQMMLEIIERSIAALPSNVRWYGPEELLKIQDETVARETIQETVEVIKTFVVARGWMELMQGDETLNRALQEIALRHNCIIFVQKDGSILFRSRA